MADLKEFMRKIISEDFAGKVMASPNTYRVARLLVRRQHFPFKAAKMMAAMGLEQTAAAYYRRAPVVWTSAFFPVELMHALGLVPFAPEVGAATAASLNLAAGLMLEAEGGGFATDGCSFHRCAAGGAFKKYFPLPDLLLASSHLCDGAPQLFRFLANKMGKPFYCLDVPAVHNRESEQYVASQLQDLAAWLEKLTGRKLTREKIEQAFAHANRAREALLRVNRLREHVPSPLRSGEGLAYVYLMFLGFGHPQTPLVFETLAAELAEANRKAAGQTAAGEEIRLLWLHLKPYYDSDLLVDLEENLHCHIVFEEMNHVYWEPLDPEQPFLSLARKALSHPALGPISKRVGVIEQLCSRYEVRAVVQFSHWGCRQAVGGVAAIKEQLARKGLPFLSLEGDCVDRGSFPPGQMRTRMESFVEMLTG